MYSFDYIIVGAGSAGCVLANRLSANPETSILLIEAGPADRSLLISMPSGYGELMESKYSWQYHTEEEAQLGGRKMFYPRGKTLGGSSSINALLYVRGSAEDYNHWAALGNKGWSYQEVLPYFKKSERNLTLNNSFHGNDGELLVTNAAYQHPLSDMFLDAATSIGLPHNEDFNGATQHGVGRYQITASKGRRCSASDAFLKPVQQRKNLTIWTNTTTEKIHFSGTTATGLRCRRKGKVIDVSAKEEIILAAGAINSPQLLMLSGIGDATEFSKHGIETVMNLPGVGKNLQDHPLIPLIHDDKKPYQSMDTMRPWYRRAAAGANWLMTHGGPASSNVCEVGGFDSVTSPKDQPDVQYVFFPAAILDSGRVVPEVPGMSSELALLRPESRGQISLKDAKPDSMPKISANYFSAPNDMEVAVEGFKKMREITQEKPYAAASKCESLPGVTACSNKQIAQHIRSTCQTQYHPVGTCKMGHDELAVVDDQLKVRGIEKLRVIDASIMPTIVSGNTNAACIMIGEKGADLILQDAP